MSEIKNYITTDSGEFDPSRLGYPISEDLDYEKWLDKVNAENLAKQMAVEGQLTEQNAELQPLKEKSNESTKI